MGRYSIKQLSSLTGIKPHTLRVWEQRYNLIEPHRTKTNIRYYDADHLKKLLNVSLLVNSGIRISDVCSMSEEEIKDEIEKITCCHLTKAQDLINGFMVSMIEMDEIKFEQIYKACVEQYGFDSGIEKVIYPFLIQVGFMWGINEINPGQEHFVSNLIRRKIIVEIDKIKPVSKGEVYLLFLPKGEYHEIGLLMFEFLLRKRNKKVIYLGQDVPWEDIVASISRVSPDYLCTFFVANIDDFNGEQYLKDLWKLFNKKGKILLSGRQEYIQNIRMPDEVVWLKTVEDTRQFLTK